MTSIIERARNFINLSDVGASTKFSKDLAQAVIDLDEIKRVADAATYSDGGMITDANLAGDIERIRRTLRGGLPDLLTSEKADLIQVIERYRNLRSVVSQLVEALKEVVEYIEQMECRGDEDCDHCDLRIRLEDILCPAPEGEGEGK